MSMPLTPAQPTATPAPPGGALGAAEGMRVALEYDMTGDLRFLSHHDELRMLMRALVRAHWPLAYSRGFNPHPRIVVPLPRSVGQAADAQLALVDLERVHPTDELQRRLVAVLPPGCCVRRVAAVPRRIVPHARQAVYEVEIEPVDLAPLHRRLPALLARASLRVHRDGGPRRPPHEIDVRPFVESITLEGAALRLWLRIERQQSARPAELLTQLGLDTATYAARVRRVAVQWNWESLGP